ncbi:hypothetical protein LT679_17075 [Mucilaginibacter roseus]|uniref:Lipocalin-like domain-containing protein n=1 Tax=Mucilaginibacter roseus TaxID=1528868 RepID=A0ABS8U7V8_9SPHI|nr:hypothetical protein [Mucilaginibacter roseus]MCD8742325.1 hypothetical protein [Mucilaginibacter roseus]
MKTYLCYIVLFISFLSSCSKGEKVCCDPIVQPQLPEFYVYGYKNDTSWVAEPNTCYLFRNRIYLEVKSSAETLNISVEEFKGKGKYNIAGGNCRYTDINGVEYLADFSPVNAFEVEEYDDTTGVLSGVLTVNMKLRMPATAGNAVPEIYFSKGRFRLALSK